MLDRSMLNSQDIGSHFPRKYAPTRSTLRQPHAKIGTPFHHPQVQAIIQVVASSPGYQQRGNGYMVPTFETLGGVGK
jgi:hypothetical protein